MTDSVDTLIKKIESCEKALVRVLSRPVPEKEADKKTELLLARGIAMQSQEVIADYRKQKASLKPEEIKKIEAAVLSFFSHSNEAAEKYPEKTAFIKKGAAALKLAKPKAATAASTDGKADGDKAGREFKEWMEGAGAFLNDAFGDIKDTALDLFNSAKDAGEDASDAVRNFYDGLGKKPTAEPDKGADGAGKKDDTKKEGIWEQLKSWFSDFKGKEIAGAGIGGALGFMLGKIFGEGTIGTILSVVLGLAGAIMGHNYAHKKSGGTAAVPAAGANGAGAGAGTTPPGGSLGAPDAKLQAAAAAYHGGQTAPRITDIQMMDYAIAHGIKPNFSRNSGAARGGDDLYPR